MTKNNKAFKRNGMVALIGVAIAIFTLLIWSKRKSSEGESPQENAVLSETGVKRDNSKRPAQTVEKRTRKHLKSSENSSLPSQDVDSENGKLSQEDSVRNSSAVEYLKTQDYSAMSPAEVDELLNLLTLGEGKEFQNSRANHLTNLASYEKSYPAKLAFLDRLEGLYRSDFVNSVPRADDSGYTVELRFGKNRLKAAIVQNSQVYYQHTFTDLKSQLMTGKSSDLPPNIFIEMPAKPELGYVHPIYLEVMIGSDLRSLIAVMYNTNQFVKDADYVHAENLIFSKTE